jgi:hypothetical protein
MSDVKTSPPRTAGAIIAALRAEALSMRKPEGDVAAELADELAATLHANSSIALPEGDAPALLGLVQALTPLEQKQWFAASIAVSPETHYQVQALRNAMAVARRQLGLTA